MIEDIQDQFIRILQIQIGRKSQMIHSADHELQFQ